MSRQYKSYDKDFKKTVVSLYENGKGISELSREYGNIINLRKFNN